MKTETISSFVERVVRQLKPSDLRLRENKLAVSTEIEAMLLSKGWSTLQFGNFVRKEIGTIRVWLSDTCDLSIDTLTEICQVFHISLGDLTVEEA